MGILAWFRVKLLLKLKIDEESGLHLLRKEIEKLKKENRDLKEKIIILPQSNKEQIPIKFFDENIEEVIIKNIREAKVELCVAVAWFTSKTLMDELSKLKRRGVKIKVIISEDYKNLKEINKLSSACTTLKTVVIPKIVNRNYNNLMHNKYCIIDNKRVIDGSYNWSANAKYNIEHVIVIESRIVSKMYKENFNKIYNNPKYYRYANEFDALG